MLYYNALVHYTQSHKPQSDTLPMYSYLSKRHLPKHLWWKPYLKQTKKLYNSLPLQYTSATRKLGVVGYNYSVTTFNKPLSSFINKWNPLKYNLYTLPTLIFLHNVFSLLKCFYGLTLVSAFKSLNLYSSYFGTRYTRTALSNTRPNQKTQLPAIWTWV